MTEIFYKNCLNTYWTIKPCTNNYSSLTDTFDLWVDPEHKRPFCSFALYISSLKLGSFWLSYQVLPLSLKHLATPKTLEPRSDDGHTTKLSFESVLRTLLSMSFDLRRRTIRKKWKYNTNNDKTGFLKVKLKWNVIGHLFESNGEIGRYNLYF